MLLRVLPELVVVLAFDEVTTHARDLLHAHTVVRKDPAGSESSTKGPRNSRLRLSPQRPKGAVIRHGNIRGHRRAPPHLCPTSNAQTRQLLKDGASQIPELAEQLGVDIGTLRIFGPDHIILAVVEADDIDSVRNFALQSRLMQWNTVKINATYSIEEAVAMIDQVEAIFCSGRASPAWCCWCGPASESRTADEQPAQVLPNGLHLRENPANKPNSGLAHAWIAPRRSPVRVRLAPSEVPANRGK